MPYCPDCKSLLKYMVSNNKAPNNYRIRVYRCDSCNKKSETNKLVAITKKIVPESETWEIINADIFENPKI